MRMFPIPLHYFSLNNGVGTGELSIQTFVKMRIV